MEAGREYRFQSNRSESINAFYTQLEQYVFNELERDRNFRAEIEEYSGYVSWMQRAVPRGTQDRDLEVEYVHHASELVAFPSLPADLPAPNDRIPVGEHMIVTLGQYANYCWPDKGMEVLELTDGYLLKPVTGMGKIDIVRNLPVISNADGAVFKFARHLLKSTTESLIELAQLSESRSQINYVEIFGGVSHLARLGGKLHFTVFPIIDERDRNQATAISKNVANHVVGGVAAWKELEQNYKPAEVAYISCEHLIAHYGAQAIDRGFTPPER